MRKARYWSVVFGAAIVALSFATAEEVHSKREPANGPHGGPAGHPAFRPEPRAHGVPQHGAEHHVMPTPGRVFHAPVFHDPRGLGDVRRDPHIVRFEHNGWHPVGHWDHWYRPDWGVFWRISEWSAIRTVTCEAVNRQTGELFPVTETRSDSWVWDSSIVNSVAARALDECVTEGGNPEICSLVQAECWNSVY